MRTMIIGADGQLGSDLVRVLDGELIALTHRDIEISESISVNEAIRTHEPDLVINTAAYHKVDDAEGNPVPAFEVNALGARNVALACVRNSAQLCHVSTDYVFSGDKKTPYVETDLPGPLNVYGTSKLAGENFVRSTAVQSYVVRTTGLFGLAGSRDGRTNFVETMFRLGGQRKSIRVVADQRISPTYTYDLAVSLRTLLTTGKYGTYHLTNSGSCSWHEFAMAIFDLTGLSPELMGVTSSEFGASANRPKYSVLSNDAAVDVGLAPSRSWREALVAYLEERNLLA